MSVKQKKVLWRSTGCVSSFVKGPRGLNGEGLGACCRSRTVGAFARAAGVGEFRNREAHSQASLNETSSFWHHPGKSDTLISEKMITEVSNATKEIHGGV